MENNQHKVSVIVPVYNTVKYLKQCVNSLIEQTYHNLEILLIDDGSTDDSGALCDWFANKYSQIQVLHKENGGLVSAWKYGVEHSTGEYLCFVDSDDWVDEDAYHQILDKLKEIVGGSRTLDMFISNFVYEKQGAKHKKVMRYTKQLPQNEIFTWSDIRRFTKGKYLLMHSVIYRTKLLRECGLQLPEHTFYVDNIFVYKPLPSVNTMYYLDVDFYRYFIGRDDQSVNEKVMIGRIDQQIKVNKLMVDEFDLWKITNRKLRGYMFNYLEIITVISTVMCIRSGTDENLEKKRELWGYIKRKDLRLFHHLRNGILGQSTNLPGRGGRKISIAAYKITQKVVGFN